MSRSNDLAFMRLLCTAGVDLIAQVPLGSEYLCRPIPAGSLSMIRVDALRRLSENAGPEALLRQVARP